MDGRHPTHLGLPRITHEMSRTSRWDHFLAQCGLRPGRHQVKPGLYALGNPTADSPVFVTANYTLSFDALRSALAGIDGYILVLDTCGVNVWCAAARGTFGTEALVHRIAVTRLHDVVHHRLLILPQLAAPGVAAHEVAARTGFTVEYGPVRAQDLPRYLEARQASAEMRRVQFYLLDRLAVIPATLVRSLVPMALAAAILYATGGLLAAAFAVAIVLTGVVLYPVLLPWLPTDRFTAKGLFLGGVTALPFALAALAGYNQSPWWFRGGWALASLLVLPTAVAYLGLRFSSATPYASTTHVRWEILTYVPMMAWLAGAGFLLIIILSLLHVLGGV